MPELRKDYLLNEWVIVSEARGKRPHQLVTPKLKKGQIDFFAPGNEKETPPEIGRLGSPWEVRWFPNKFAATTPEGDTTIHKQDFFQHAQAVGHHEVIVETNTTKQLHELDKKAIAKVLQAYTDRLTTLDKEEKVAYITLFKNHGAEAGTSLVHSHSQLITTPILPPRVQAKVEARNRFVECPHCKIIEMEKQSSRFCMETKEWLAFCPYAPRFQYEIWLYPKQHKTRIEEVDREDLAEMLKKILPKVAHLGSYNLFVLYSPKNEDMHFHIEICPRLGTWAGFEMSSGIIITSVTPEQAAEYYK